MSERLTEDEVFIITTAEPGRGALEELAGEIGHLRADVSAATAGWYESETGQQVPRNSSFSLEAQREWASWLSDKGFSLDGDGVPLGDGA